jgi:hypothetical protein
MFFKLGYRMRRMREKRFALGTVFLIFIGSLLLVGSLAFGDVSNAVPEFQPRSGKIFRYTARQLGMTVLRASIKIENGFGEGGKPLYQVQANIDSVNLGFLLRMKNRFIATMDMETCWPIQYVKEIDQEGLFVQNKKYTEVLTFDSARQKVVVERKGVPEKKEISLPLGTYDPLSMFARCYLREDLFPGQDIRMSIFDGVKLRQMVFHSEKERVRSSLMGEVEAVRLESTTSFSSFGDKEGIIRIWYTADGKKDPVALELDLPIGSVRFELAGIEES